jgi:hypothetical protein
MANANRTYRTLADFLANEDKEAKLKEIENINYKNRNKK